MSVDKSTNSGFDWLYPELLSNEDLKNTLKQRYIKVGDIDNLEKHELVNLYYKFIIPLPQRKYRLNRRGREMTKKQILNAKKRKPISVSEDDQPPAKRKSTGNLVTSFDVSSCGGDRLKPPPSCVNFKKKTIKLGSSSTSTSQTVSPISSSLHELKITKLATACNDSRSASPPKRLKLINSKLSKSENNVAKPVNSETLESNNKDIQIMQTQTTGKAVNEVLESSWPMDTSENSINETHEKKKLTKISWP